MIRSNPHYEKLRSSYLFSDIAKRVAAHQESHPGVDIIRLGIGDVTHALPDACVAAFHRGVDEMANDATFRGYGPEQGYAFLREKIASEDFKARGADIDSDEIFVSDGAKCDTGNFQELFSTDIRIAIPDPVYPVYLDTNVMAGRTGEFKDGRYGGVSYMDCTAENNFVPDLPQEQVDLIYLCFPNNPTGTTITKPELKRWVDYAHEAKALILFDAAYEAFIRDDTLPRSIYEIEGAKEVAVEFRSFSKTAGFTGTRCAYTVVPKACRVFDQKGAAIALHPLWNRRHTTKFNGVSYPVQRAAEAVYSTEGKAQVKALADGYLDNAGIIRRAMDTMGFDCVGGIDSPYVWINGNGRDSWAFFDLLLKKAGVVCTPGTGFGQCGEGYIRISAFNSREKVETAMARMKEALGS
ncbi:predicted aspartate aminotransferase (transaminase A) (AspAT) [Desulforapulum autotrophicum HRM2]|uniref:LL-diaminopimelate aminotransferase n=1 Tax=Desulforapulum autotrophicum (strain ATCC 43914 / DSM 3382 / VKM B-1955 / HRM2) TaxID=177437 RepID=DAPAT_DESAH|nr:LL-diaminopimelate aminotransferase [Desulforapulum autotrophicum]C0QFJ4.1 RecName: Full=LL-diaminopimelate aminotransferase; Short=DAP-AT; Short=DAP-aminotransferase; Short=LL-DAP-aminotransferase [Desulforapulum autotrophicum HRM2]ACN13390.1 predicted aspartate aminotransferase (transaminase A) (AspAT) [Desulforapulum autotrophicum HRM2]